MERGHSYCLVTGRTSSLITMESVYPYRTTGDQIRLNRSKRTINGMTRPVIHQSSMSVRSQPPDQSAVCRTTKPINQSTLMTFFTPHLISFVAFNQQVKTTSSSDGQVPIYAIVIRHDKFVFLIMPYDRNANLSCLPNHLLLCCQHHYHITPIISRSAG